MMEHSMHQNGNHRNGNTNGMGNGNGSGSLNGYQIPQHHSQPSMMNHPNPAPVFTSFSPSPGPMQNAMQQMQLQPGTMPDLAGVIYGDSALLEDQEAKRRRIARACDMCRKKKIKCDGKLPQCTHCINYKTHCAFTTAEKKRTPPKGAKYIEALENRNLRLERILVAAGFLPADDNGHTDLAALERRVKITPHNGSRRASTMAGSNPTTPNEALSFEESGEGGTPYSLASPESVTRGSDKRHSTNSGDKSVAGTPGAGEPGSEDVEALSDQMCSLVTNNCGETRYIGSSSGFSIFSPMGIQWVHEKTGDSSFQRMIQESSVDENKMAYWKADVFEDLFSRKVFQPLPPKEEALSLLKDYFENLNCMFPLFHQETFMYLVDQEYEKNPLGGSGWWASLNVALALAHRLRVMSGLVPAKEDQQAWGYMKNALATVTELILRNTDLLSVQALLGMSIFLQGTPNPQPAYALVAAAIRLSHSIGLHKRGSGFNLNPIEIEMRKRVFWIAYMLDKDICLRTGRPPAQCDDDMNVELPETDPADNIGNIPLSDGKKVNLFHLMCSFAQISSNVYKRLYCSEASKQTDGSILFAIGELDLELEAWKDSIPIDLRPEHEIKASHTPLMLNVVVLHFAYYNCLTTIHRMSVQHGYWTSRLSDFAAQGLNSKRLNPRVFQSAQICATAARSSIQLLPYVPQGDFPCVWLILYFPVSALVTLCSYLLLNPHDDRANTDVRLMENVVTFLSMLVAEEENGGVKRMLGVCSFLHKLALTVVDKHEKDKESKKKRKNTSDDTAKNSRIASTHQQPAITVKLQGQSPMHDPQHNPQRVAQMHQASPQAGFSPVQQSVSPMSNQWQQTQNNQFMPPPSQYGMPSMEPFGDMSFGGDGPIDMSFFNIPQLPVDMFQESMSNDWQWAEMTGGNYQSFENGLVADPTVTQHMLNSMMNGGLHQQNSQFNQHHMR